MTTRRERLREATVREIQEAARQHLRAHGPAGISLRAIARDMGMTAPALYRYYASLNDLVTAMIESYKAEIGEALEAARDAVPADDLGGRLAAAARAFRRWALDHRPEFTMVFGAPPPGYEPRAEGEIPSVDGLGMVFFTLLTDLWRRERFPIPADEDIPAGLREQLEHFSTSCGLDRAGLPLGLIRVFVGCWVRLYGLVAMEAFGHVHFVLDDAEPLFEAELAEVSAILGIARPLPPGHSPSASAAQNAAS
ncbi:TetR/AcrR family transcriptional regulator [Actinoallomurus sp. NPDC052308]|uniref:TetR/AcrR family transcriptional regulator n=1 Tax=Actinoallomurus sp. NPDC052308 TaxID=3155530 RepID=UPI00342E3D2E